MAARVAFLIGNQTFQPDSGLLPLQGPANDIAALGRLLRNPERGNFAVSEFLDKDRNQVLPVLERAFGSAALGDLFLIYYSGHGKLTRNGHLCLATADTQEDALRSTSIPARDLRDLVAASHCDQVVLLLDCCYSGAVDDGLRGDIGSELQVVDDARGFYIMTASTSIQVARETVSSPDGGMMGRFTAVLVTGLESGAADQGRKGKILLSDIRRYLGQADIGSTPQFFDRRASGDPLISLSPATAARSEAAMSRLVEMFKDPDEHIRQSAADALDRIGPPAVPALVATLKDPDEGVRQRAAAVLSKIGPNAADAVPALAAALEDPDRGVRHFVAEALAKIGPDAADAVPALIGVLKHSDANTWLHAADALAKIGPAAMPALIAALKDLDESVRCRAPIALAEFGPNAADAVPALAAALKDPHKAVRGNAALALGEIGPYAADVAPALVAALKDPDEGVQHSAAGALRKIGTAAAPALAAACKDPDEGVRQRATEVLCNISTSYIPG